MRYVYKQPAISVDPPRELSPPAPASPTDTLQDLLQRRAEVGKNRLLFHLTEADCTLICTNATELKYTEGQVVATEGAVIQAVYRIKSGNISLMKGGIKLYDLPQGHFIGEGLFIRGEAKDVYGAALVANGPVVLSQVNLAFVRRMLDMDKVLAFKIYRHIASKLSSLLFSLVARISNEPHTLDLSLYDSTSSGSPDGYSLASLSSNGNGSELDVVYPPKAVIMSEEMMNNARLENKKKKKKSFTCKNTTKDVAFKTYQLQESHNACAQAVLYSRKVIFTSGSKIISKRKIKYNKILDMAKTGRNSVTIIYGVQARTMFFKDESERNEFYGLVQSLIGTTQLPSAPPRSMMSPILTNPLSRSLSMDPATVAADKQVLTNLAVRQDLVKGNIVVAEGDLYQRIYTVASGQLQMKLGDRTFVTIEEGEVFGVLTLFHLRPCNISIEVASDTATLLIIPNYRIQELITSNFPLAVRMHKKAAQLVYAQIERILLSREGPVRGFSPSGLLL